MNRKKIGKLIVDIQVSADMSKDWLNRNGIGKSETIWNELENILSAAENIFDTLNSGGEKV